MSCVELIKRLVIVGMVVGSPGRTVSLMATQESIIIRFMFFLYIMDSCVLMIYSLTRLKFYKHTLKKAKQHNHYHHYNTRTNSTQLVCFQLRVIVFILQVLPIYIISFLFVIHVYIRPYTRLVDNVLEAVVLLNYILLLVFRSCQAILDHLDTYTGLMVPSNVDELPNSQKVIIFFSIFFYFPIVLGIVSIIVWIIHKIW